MLERFYKNIFVLPVLGIFSCCMLVFFSLRGNALETGDIYEHSDTSSAMAIDTVSNDDNLYGASETLQPESSRDNSGNDFNDDNDTVYYPNSSKNLTDTGDIHVAEPPTFSSRNFVLDSGFTATAVSEDIHALRNYSEFFLFGFVPISIAGLLFALGCNWFYKTFISSTFF